MKTKLLLLSMMMLCSMIAFSQSYYYYNGKKEYVNEDLTKITILSKPSKAMKNAKSITTDLQKLQTISDARYDISVYSLVNTKTKSTSSLKAVLAETLEDAIVLPCYTDKNGSEMVMTNYLSVKLKSESDIDVLYATSKEYGLEIVDQNKYMPLWYSLSITSETEKTTLDVANELFESGLFASAFSDFTYDARMCSNDPEFTTQWGLYNSTYSNMDISICSAWNYATGRGIKIAVLDEGVELTHSDLAPNAYLSYDTETSTSPCKVYGSHGTHCAGIALAVRNNGKNIVGVAPDAKLMAISNRLAGGANMELYLANGINWAWQNGADIISCSWRARKNDILDDAINLAITNGRNKRGTILVFAAGNYDETPVLYPANLRPEIIAVGSIDKTGNRSSFSCIGAELDVLAPGRDINSTMTGNRTGYDSGTSMATPHVAGIAALILERNPSLTLKQVSDIIEKSCKKVGSMAYNTNKTNGTWNSYYGYGLVNAYTAVINTPRTYSLLLEDEDVITNSSETTIKIDAIYPNPATNMVVVRFENKGKGDFQLIVNSLAGNINTTYNVSNMGSNEFTIDLSKYPKGAYSVSLISGGKIVSTSKLIKE